MSVNEEFLDEVLQDVVALGTDHSNDPPAPQSIEEAKKAILQHFQQEQEELVHDLTLYKLLFGSIKDPYGKVDTMLAFKNYKEKEDFHKNFGNYMEAVRTELGSKIFTQSEVDRLIREAIEKELKKAIEYARNLPDVGIRYPEDREKCREFARASSVMTNYASTRLESWLSKHKEGSK